MIGIIGILILLVGLIGTMAISPEKKKKFYRRNPNNMDYGSQGSQRFYNGSCKQRHGTRNDFGQSYNHQNRPNPSREDNGLDRHFNNMNINYISCFVTNMGSRFVRQTNNNNQGFQGACTEQ